MKELFELFSRKLCEKVVVNAMFSTMMMLGEEMFREEAQKHFFMITVLPMLNGGWEALIPVQPESKKEMAENFRIIASRPEFNGWIHIDTENCANTQIAVKIYNPL